MLEKLKAWINSKQDYGQGVALFIACCNNPSLQALLLGGVTAYNKKKLKDALTAEYEKLCAASSVLKPAKTVQKSIESVIKNAAGVIKTPFDVKKESLHVAPAAVVNTELLQSAEREASRAWKELMNKRNELFALTRVPEYADENSQILVANRGHLALDILEYNKKVVTPAYDKLRYVKQHGKLPTGTKEEKVSEDYDQLPDHRVKDTIDNLRKNLGKMRKREQTPERVALIQKHEASLQKLLKRWEGLK